MFEKQTFKIGDIVKNINISSLAYGLYGRVVTICNDVAYGVSYLNYDVGHTCGGKCAEGTGRWENVSELEFISSAPGEDNPAAPPCEETESMETCEPTLRDPENGALCECQVPEENSSEKLVCYAEPQYYDAHYGGDIQPIELMQMIMTPEEFKGFLKGNIIKYTMRCGKKDDPEKELTKIRRYKQWLDLAEAGEIINPRM